MKWNNLVILAALILTAATAVAGDEDATVSGETALEDQVAVEVDEEQSIRETLDRPAVEPRTVVVYDPDAETRWHGEPISLSLREADLIEVLRTFAKIADMNLVVDPRVHGTVTVELHEVPWDQALHLILKTHGLAMDVSGPTLWQVERSSARR